MHEYECVSSLSTSTTAAAQLAEESLLRPSLRKDGAARLARAARKSWSCKFGVIVAVNLLTALSTHAGGLLKPARAPNE